MRSLPVIVASSCLLLALSNQTAIAQSRDRKESGQDAPIVYTNEDLPAAPPAAPARTPAALPTSTPAPDLPSHDGVRDRNGHGEGWWRQRAAELEARVLEARIEAQTLHVKYARGKTLTDATLAPRSRAATELLLSLEEELAALPEELRRAGGMPGWLRPTGLPLPTESLPAPEPLDPANLEAPTIGWKPVQLAGFYLVEVQCLDCCEPLGPCDPRTLDTAGTRLRLPYEADRSGQWRVRALDAVGVGGDWSDWAEFGPDAP